MEDLLWIWLHDSTLLNIGLELLMKQMELPICWVFTRIVPISKKILEINTLVLVQAQGQNLLN